MIAVWKRPEPGPFSDAGRIVECGSHRELLGRDSAYAQMWALQQQQEEATTAPV